MSILHYTEAGQGEALILLHSGGMSGREWDPQMAALAQRFRVVAPDQLGHGNSPMVADRLAIGDIGREVVKLMDRLDIAQAHFVGSSMGGAVALWLAVNDPQRLKKLVLFRVGYRKNSHTNDGIRTLSDPEYWRGLGLQGWLSNLHKPQGGPEAWKIVLGRVAQAMDPATTDHAHDLSVLAKVQASTLIAVGDRDPLVPLDHAMEMFRTIPDASLWVLPNASHVTATNTWRANCFSLEITRFIQRRA
ncbi:MAG: alpha/beta fold hydrolase [Gammaproteobacteria bacterium]|nr:alpha/beta fold hydrolase [Gammaproteobacteria bacterium]MCP5425698.1 alpha/beta fold hydrolase [Gammaproteobacteria bacterium]MCP5459729.1 alpha/beta fold hydrolase [Gammaproteobacteria bacterium]